MKNKLFFALFVLLFVLSAGNVLAQTVESTPPPSLRFGKDVRDMRQQNNQDRKDIRDLNKQMRDSFKYDAKASREALLKENKTERNQLNADQKKLLEGKTPEERLTLMPTLRAERKELQAENKTERMATQSAIWDAKKNVIDNIRANMDSFRTSVKSRWTALWNSFFGKK